MSDEPKALPLNEDGTLSIPQQSSLTSDQLEAHIMVLMHARSRMDPPPALSPSLPRNVVSHPGFAAATSTTGDVMLKLWHPGLGWLGFIFKPEKAVVLGEHLAGSARGLEQGVRPEIGDGATRKH